MPEQIPPGPAPDPQERTRQSEFVLKAARCAHEHRAGGNDYLTCSDCQLMWDYRRETANDALVRLMAQLEIKADTAEDIYGLTFGRTGRETATQHAGWLKSYISQLEADTAALRAQLEEKSHEWAKAEQRLADHPQH